MAREMYMSMFYNALTKRLRQQNQIVPDEALAEFESVVLQWMPTDKEYIDKIVKFVMSMDYSSHPGSKSKTGYMNHPLRMATLAAEMFTDEKQEGVVVSLVHNILEVTPVTTKELAEIVGEPVAGTVEVLTVDRIRQKDIAYKISYYRNIQNRGLVAAGIKVLDKYDNLFLLGLNSDADVRKWYLDEIDEHVIPLARFCEPIMPGIENETTDFFGVFDFV